MNREKLLQNVVLLSFFSFCIYYAYRYILKYSSTLTSPTYAETPASFQLFKYVLCVAFFLFGIFVLIKCRVRVRLYTFEVLLLIMFAVSLIKFLFVRNYDFLLKNFIFIFSAYLVVFIRKDNYFFQRFLFLNKVIFFYHVVYAGIQLILYEAMGRLPALGYRGGFVRFGGGWDDPNAFGVYLILPISYFLCQILSKGFTVKAFAGVFVSSVLEVLTISFSGYAGVAIAFILIAIRYRRKKESLILYMIVILGIVIILQNQSLIYVVMKAKSQSTAGHIKYFVMQVTNENYLEGLFWGNQQYTFSENYYATVLQNYGLPYLLAVLALLGYVLYVCYHVYKHNRKSRVYTLILIFVIAVDFIQVGIAYLMVFPINYLYWLLFFIAYKQYRKEREQRLWMKKLK